MGEVPAVSAPLPSVPRQSAFLHDYPEYADTLHLDEVRATEYAYLDHGGHVYLDYTGAGLAAHRQLQHHVQRLERGCFGNPHSASPSSQASTQLVESARAAVLARFNASPQEYTAIFTPNATGACRLVGEAYPFRPGRRFAQLVDNHNSVNGIREFARSRGATLDTVGIAGSDLRADPTEVEEVLRRSRPWLPSLRGRKRAGGRVGLFAYPAQSNFTGVQHSLDWIESAHEYGWDVLLDAAAFAPANRLDLSEVKPDFVPVSWYKVCGYPTGLGCLVARRQALARLERPWFSGGTITAASVLGDWHRLAGDEAGFEDGTVNFLSIPDIEAGLGWLDEIGVDPVHTRVRCLTGWLIDHLTAARHSTGMPLVRLYGPATTRARGGTVAFNFLDPRGRVIDERVVARDAAAHRISLRTGCFCNPGAGEAAFNLDPVALADPGAERPFPLEDYLGRLGLPSGGAIRVSLGLVSNFADVARFLEFAVTTYLDQTPDERDLPARSGC
ncbi:aminotransferase class V-fold PLP-dependent enzyme [Salinactinospora qingdaonensis]|uniref:Aminotransferase class V-fold PLP-dependent enzyme n=1 Tax=Salinactinospora qingdaonensis TaxID=702744 RepID=A0ABP7G5Z5_9ACTN